MSKKDKNIFNRIFPGMKKTTHNPNSTKKITKVFIRLYESQDIYLNLQNTNFSNEKSFVDMQTIFIFRNK